MLKPDVLKKKYLVLYRAYVMQAGDTMQVNPSGETFSLNVKDAVTNLLRTYKDPKELEALKGSIISMLEVRILMTRFTANDKSEEVDQIGSDVTIALNSFVGDYRMAILKYKLENFDMTINQKDNGHSLEFSNIELEKIDQ